MEKRRVVVTGLGAITPIGHDVHSMWQGIKEEKCGIDFITKYDCKDRKVKVAAEIKNYTPVGLDKKAARKMDHFSQYAVIAAKEAFQDAALDKESYNADRFGVMISSGMGGLETWEKEEMKALEKGYDRVSPFYVPMVIANLAAGNVAIALQAKGMCSCPVTACAGGTNAIGDAFRSIRDGYHEIMACGGTEATITPLGIGGFTAMKALSESEDPMRASIPFDKNRNGFVMGEGAGVLILEEYEHARARNAHIYAEVIGYGTSCDAYHITAPDAQGEGGAKAMKNALQDANILPGAIDYINAHGTSTPLNDKMETLAVKKAFQEEAYNIPISSTKSMTGHLLGAAGGVEGIICVKSLQEGFIPATIHIENMDPECDLPVITTGTKQKLQFAMSNSLGFGGHNASIIFKAMEDNENGTNK